MIRLAPCLAALMLGATAAPAATLVATPTGLNEFFSGFQLDYTDTNGNGVIDFDEITGFGGVDQTVNTADPKRQTFLSGLPAIDKISVAGAAPWVSPDPYNWQFSGSDASDPQVGGSADFWTYVLKLEAEPAPVSPVPLPTSALLLVTAGAGLLAVRRGGPCGPTGAPGP